MKKFQHRQHSIGQLPRNHSHKAFTFDQTKTIAEINHVSSRHHKYFYSPFKPFRILLPGYFNIPNFIDQAVIGEVSSSSHREAIFKMRAEIEVRRKLKDL
jgi:hypothetical protein